MGDIHYTPTVEPPDFADGEPIRASGPNGFNALFHAIEDDLTQFSSVVADIDAALTAIATGPTEHSQWLPPQLLGLNGFAPWLASATGGAQDTAGSTSGGLVNLILPDGVRLTALRAIGQCTSGVVVTIKLSRCAFGSATVRELATITGNGNPFDVTIPVDPSLARVDTGSFRYFLTATATAGPAGGANAVIGAFQLAHSTV